MGRRVDAKSKTGYDRQASFTERTREALRGALALRGRVAAADYSQRGSSQQVETAMCVEQRGWIRYLK